MSVRKGTSCMGWPPVVILSLPIDATVAVAEPELPDALPVPEPAGRLAAADRPTHVVPARQIAKVVVVAGRVTFGLREAGIGGTEFVAHPHAVASMLTGSRSARGM